MTDLFYFEGTPNLRHHIMARHVQRFIDIEETGNVRHSPASPVGWRLATSASLALSLLQVCL